MKEVERGLLRGQSPVPDFDFLLFPLVLFYRDCNFPVGGYTFMRVQAGWPRIRIPAARITTKFGGRRRRGGPLLKKREKCRTPSQLVSRCRTTRSGAPGKRQ